MQKLIELQKKREALEAEMLQESRRIFAEVASGLFQANPKLSGFRWAQYTPYFNDGDVCTFEVHDSECLMDIPGLKEDSRAACGDDGYVHWYGAGNHKMYANPVNQEVVVIQDSVDRFMQQFPSDILEKMFGDGVQIVVTREGVEVEEYDHE